MANAAAATLTTEVVDPFSFCGLLSRRRSWLTSTRRGKRQQRALRHHQGDGRGEPSPGGRPGSPDLTISKEDLLAYRTRAAITLQAAYRGHLARRRVQEQFGWCVGVTPACVSVSWAVTYVHMCGSAGCCPAAGELGL